MAMRGRKDDQPSDKDLVDRAFAAFRKTLEEHTDKFLTMTRKTDKDGTALWPVGKSRQLLFGYHLHGISMPLWIRFCSWRRENDGLDPEDFVNAVRREAGVA